VTKVGHSMSDLDPFTKQRFPEIARRWMDAQRAHQRTERLLWLGTMAASFSDDELSILNTMGYVCPSDRDLLARAARPVKPWSLPDASAEIA
jgi:hypothetical protein